MPPLAACACALVLKFLAGCDAAHSATEDADAATPSAICHAPAQPIRLATGLFNGVAIHDGQVIFVGSSSALQRVALGGGAPETLSSTSTVSGLALVGDLAYVSSERGLNAVPLGGGDPTLVENGFSSTTATTDDESAYFATTTNDVLVVTPPSKNTKTLQLGMLLIVGLAAYDQNVYAARANLSATPPADSGIITRVPKRGGPATQLIATVDLPNAIAVDRDGIYWTEQSTSFGVGRLARADLDGQHEQTLVMTDARALAIDKTYVYFLTDSLNRIPKLGGAVEVLVTNLEGPGYLVVSGKDAAWVNLANKAMSDARPGALQAVCLPD